MTELDLDANVSLDTADFDLDGARNPAGTAGFATIQDYETIKGVTITPGSAQERQVQAALDTACQEIRNETGQDIDFVAADEIRLFGNCRKILILPQLPVVAVNAVTLDKGLPTESPVTDFVVTNAGILYRLAGWPFGVGNVTVNYDHGYNPIPADLINVAVQHAFGIVSQRPPGIQSESIDGYSYTLDAGANPSLEPYAKVLARYRLPEIPAA